MIAKSKSLPLFNSAVDFQLRRPADAGRTWRVLLINPPFQRLKGVYNLYFPLGLGYLAGSLKAAGFDCGIYNAENPQRDEVVAHNHLSLLEQHWEYIKALHDDSHFVWQEVRRTIQNFRPDILGVSVLTPVYGSAVRVNKIARELFPNVRIVWGGPHPTVQAQEILRDEPEVEFVVGGEGEVTMAQLCTELRAGSADFSHVDGITWRHPQRGTLANKHREYADDLDALPWPDKSASIYLDAYFRDPERAQLGNLFGSRGCPFKCAYCSSHTIWTRKVRYRTPESVVAEMEHLKRDFGVERFSFLDDTFTMNRKWATSICEKMIERKVNARWGCYTRLDVLREELLETMQRAGLAEMDVGIETGSQRMVDFLLKEIDLDEVRAMCKVLNRRRVNWNAFIMVGLPDETRDDIQQTIDFIHEVKPIRCILSVFTPYPGDRLFDICKERGWIPDKPDWSRFSHHSPENCFVKDIPKPEFEQLVRDMFVLIDKYNNSWSANWRLFQANRRLYVANPGRFVQKALSAAGRMIQTRLAHLRKPHGSPAAAGANGGTSVVGETQASMDLARVSGRGSGI